jgi:hypothetical protein
MKIAEQVKTKVCRGAGEWFLGSGIQETNGGVARYYFSDRKRNKPLSTEITGYTASALVNLYKQTSEVQYLDAAINAATYLVEAWDGSCAAMPFEYDEPNQRHSFFFDNGIIIRGLLAVWREFRNEDFLATAVKVGDSMAADFAIGNDFAPILELPSKTPEERNPQRWSRSSACYQLKAALGWYELWKVTNNDSYLKSYRQLLQSSLATHETFLPGVEDEFLVMDRLHPYCYFLEGLLPVIDEPAAAEATIWGIDRVAGFMRDIGPKFLRSDAVAQLLRMRIFADQFGVAPLDENVGQKEADVLQSFQSNDGDNALQGGFWFGKKNGEMMPFMNPVSTAFAYQALEMWNRRGGGTFEWLSLI